MAIEKTPFKKAATTHQEQVQKLRDRGMLIDDEARAIFHLQHVNYYRLCGYWLSFEQNHEKHIFKAGVKFDDVLHRYEFDRKLRLLILDAIERFEISIRTQWTYHLTHAYGPHAHLNMAIHDGFWRENLERLEKELARCDEDFIEHLIKTYSERVPPIWACSEIMSLGLLSKWIKSLEIWAIQKKIAAAYGLKREPLLSWLQLLSVIRNICAHHSRLWDRNFVRIRTQWPGPKTLVTINARTKPLRDLFVENDQLYNILVMLSYLTSIIEGSTEWQRKLFVLLQNYESIPTDAMGFPSNWQDLDFWQL